MDDRFPGNLNCTANDVRIARVTNITDVNGNPLASCFLGQTFTFVADFEVQLTAQARYDIGLYLATDGDPNGDGALTGQCTTSTITPENAPATFVQLDPAPDTCGDIDAAHNPQIVHMTVTTKCIDPDGDGRLNLPNCTSWRQPGSNQACTRAEDAFPGSPSKCNCDKNFNIDIRVERVSLSVGKTASPTQVDEPGGPVTFTLSVTNQAVTTSLTIEKVEDDTDNDGIADVTYPATICGRALLGPGESTTCAFQRTVSGDAGQSFTDKACISGTDSNGHPVGPVCDTATVSIKDVKPTAALTKTVEGLVCADVRFKVKVENTDPIEALTLAALDDDRFGDVTRVQGSVVRTDCSVPQAIASSGSYSCTFDAKVCGSPHTDTVTGTLSDNDGNTITASGSAQVTVTATSP